MGDLLLNLEEPILDFCLVIGIFRILAKITFLDLDFLQENCLSKALYIFEKLVEIFLVLRIQGEQLLRVLMVKIVSAMLVQRLESTGLEITGQLLLHWVARGCMDIILREEAWLPAFSDLEVVHQIFVLPFPGLRVLGVHDLLGVTGAGVPAEKLVGGAIQLVQLLVVVSAHVGDLLGISFGGYGGRALVEAFPVRRGLELGGSLVGGREVGGGVIEILDTGALVEACEEATTGGGVLDRIGCAEGVQGDQAAVAVTGHEEQSVRRKY